MTSIDLRDIDFYSEDILLDPYDFLARLRRQAPVFELAQPMAGRRQFLVASYALVEQVLRQHELFSSEVLEVMTNTANRDPEVDAILSEGWPEVPMLLTTDEPDHTRLRALAQKAFMPSRIKRMTDLIDQAIVDLVDGFAARGECDFVREFAVPLPINSIAAIMGISAEHYADVDRWTTAFFRRNGMMATREQNIADAYQIAAAKRFVAAQIEQRRAAPSDDLISDLVHASVDGVSPFSNPELLSTVMVLILGGAETTRSTLISAMVRLLQNPTQLALVRANPSLVPRAIDEVLRLDTPGTSLWRIAKASCELGGVAIPAGAIVQIRIDSANRDDAMFENSDSFDIQRAGPIRHLSFGSGIHFCIGLRLAREQLHRALPVLIERLADMSLVEDRCDLRPHPSVITRCLREVHIRFTPLERGLSTSDRS